MTSIFNDPGTSATKVFAGEVRITDDLIFWNKVTRVYKATINADDGNLHFAVANDEKLIIKSDGEFLIDGYIKSVNSSFSIATDELVFRDSALNQLGYIDSNGVMHGIQVNLGSQLPTIDINNGTTGSLLASRIVDLDASKIATGTINNDRLPTTPTFNGVNFNTLSSGDWAKLYTEGTIDAENFEQNGHRLVLELGDDADFPAEFIIRREYDSEVLFSVSGDGSVSAKEVLNAPIIEGTTGNYATLSASTKVRTNLIEPYSGSTVAIPSSSNFKTNEIRSHDTNIYYKTDTHTFSSTNGATTYATLNSSGYTSTGKVEAGFFKSGSNELSVNTGDWYMNTGLAVNGDLLTRSIASFGPLANLPYQAPTHEFKNHAGTTLYGSITSDGFVGEGSLITDLNATNIASGTINNDRLPSTIKSNDFRSRNGNNSIYFSANQNATNPMVLDTNGRLYVSGGLLFNGLNSTDYATFYTVGSTDSDHKLILELGDDADSCDFVIRRNSSGTITDVMTVNDTDVLINKPLTVRTPNNFGFETEHSTTFARLNILNASGSTTGSTPSFLFVNSAVRLDRASLTVDGDVVIGFSTSDRELRTQRVNWNSKGSLAWSFYNTYNYQGGDRFIWKSRNDVSTVMTLYENPNILDVNGDIRTNLGYLNFGSQTRQMINLWSSVYGIGVQGSTQYFRTDGHFAWYRRGVHSDAALTAGTGGAALMVLRSTGRLGIGTISPDYTLDVNGDARIIGSVLTELVKGAYPKLLSTLTNNYFTTFGNGSNYSDSNNLYIRSIGDGVSTAVFDNTNRRLGIGTPSPQQKLDVRGGNMLINWSGNAIIADGGTYYGDTVPFSVISNPTSGVLTLGLQNSTTTGTPASLGFFREDSVGNSKLVAGIYSIDGTDTLNAGDGGLEFRIAYTGVSSGGYSPLTTAMRITSYGNVGVGKSNNLTRARLDVAAGTNSTNYNQARYFRYDTSLTYNASDVFGQVSIFADDDIITRQHIVSHTGGMTSSDIRIKENIEEISDTEALDTLRLLKPKTYTYKDTLRRGNERVIGFIAQEVEQVLPLATSRRYDTIPNIYELAKVSESNVITFTDFNTSILTVNTMIDAKSQKSGDIRLTIVEVIDEHSIRVKEDIVGDQIFIMGEYVNDFTFLKKDHIWTIATAALQEVDRQQQADKERIATLESQVNNLMQIVNELRDSGTAP